MGKRIDALLGKIHLKTSKFNPIIKLAICRLSILKNQRQARHSISHSDVVQLLNLGQQHRALLRVEQVIKEQNMLDVFTMIEGYCNHLVDKVDLVKKQSVCPHELDEVISSLIYAAPRCGEFPELQKIRSILTSQFGKEYAGRASEVHNDCRVNRKMVQKLSMRQPSLENRLKVLNEIASANGITLQNEEGSLTITEEKLGVTEGDLPMNSHVPSLQDNDPLDENADRFSASTKVGRKYKDAADAAQASFESAAYAATAARAAVELSRSKSYDPDDHSSPDSRPRNMFNIHEPIQNEFRTGPQVDSQGIEERSFEMECNQFHSSQSYRSISDDEETHTDIRDEGSKQTRNTLEINASVSSSSSADKLLETTFSPNIEGHTTTSEKELYFDDRDEKNDTEQVGEHTHTTPESYYGQGSSTQIESYKLGEPANIRKDQLIVRRE